MADFGADLAALDDLPDPDQMVSQAADVGYSICRRLLQSQDAFAEIGDLEPYTCVDVRDWIGKRPSADEKRDLEATVARIAREDPRVDSATSSIVFGTSTIQVTISVVLADGPFSYVLTVDQVSAALLFQGAA